MISKVPFEVWHCDACGTVWLPRRGKDGNPERCPNRQCRKLAGWTPEAGRVKPAAAVREVKVKDSALGEVDEGGVQENGVVVNDTSDRMVRRDAAVTKTHHEANGGRNSFNQNRRRSAIRSNGGRESMAVPTAKAKGQLTAEEFMSLSSSEQLRARREGKF